MLNQEKVRDMTQMAILESGIGQKELRVTSAKRIDYVVLQLVKGFIVGTICYAAFFLLWFSMQWDNLNAVFADGDFIAFLDGAIQKYVIFIICYLVICAIVAIVYYRKCKVRQDEYMAYLEQVEEQYDDEEETDF